MSESVNDIEEVRTDGAPAAIGPYSQAIRVGGVIYCSGQVPLDPATGELVTSDVRSETKRVMENLAAVVTAGGSSMERVVRCTIFLTSMDDYAAVNEVYATFFGDPAPARACVEVSRLPKDARVEIDAIAAVL